MSADPPHPEPPPARRHAERRAAAAPAAIPAASLARLDGRRLHDLVERHGAQLSAAQVRRILRNPFVTAELIDHLAALRPQHGSAAIRRAIARHPRTAATTALRFVADLLWRDLVEIGVDVRLPAAVRRAADKYLIQRLPRLATGERLAVARRAGAPILAHLRRDPQPPVIAALLENPRLTVATLLPLAADPRCRPQVIDTVARCARWARRYEIRLALCLNPQTLFRAAFELLPGLRRDDLARVAETAALSSVVRRRAGGLLADRRRR